MTIFDHIDKYLEAREDKDAETLVEKLKSLHKVASSGPRLKAEQEWYTNERYLEGDHWLRFDRKAGTIVTPKKTKRVQRAINLVRSQLRATKNLILSQRFTWETAPGDESEEAKTEAQTLNKVLSTYIYDILDVPMKLYQVLGNGINKSFGTWELFWDDAIDELQLIPHDSFDIFSDPSVVEPRDGQFLVKVSKVAVALIKENERYNERRNQVKPDNREAASDFKDSLEKQRSEKESQEDLDETGTVLVYEFFLKRQEPVLALNEETDEEEPTDETQTRIWIATVADGKLIRDPEPLNVSRFPILFYIPERVSNRLYPPTWMKDMIAPNRTFENVFSLIEDYIVKIKPKLMRPHGSSLKPITDEMGEILEYQGAVADQLKEFNPQGLPSTHFKLMDVAREVIEDVGAAHAPSKGKVPTGVKSGRGMEALQAGDDNNVGEPKAMLERFLEETGEFILELISKHQITEKDLTFFDGKETFKSRIMGEAGVMQTPPENVFIVKPTRVRVSIVPAIGYTEEGRRMTALDLYEAGLIPRETALETFRFSNVSEIVDKVEAEQMRANAAQLPPPATTPPANAPVNPQANPPVTP